MDNHEINIVNTLVAAAGISERPQRTSYKKAWWVWLHLFKTTVVLWTLPFLRFLLPVTVQRAESTPAGPSDSPHRLLQWVLWSHGATQPPPHNCLIGHVRLVPNPEPQHQSLTLLPAEAWQFVPVCHQPRAIKPVLSAVLSAGHRRGVSSKWGSRDTLSRLAPPRTGSGAALGPSVWPWSLPWPANAGVNASRHSAKWLSNFPSGLRQSHWPLRIRLRICSEWFVLSCPPQRCAIPSLKF